MARTTKTVNCAVCGQEFEKEARRIRQAEKLGQQHTCSRKCASTISNKKRRSVPKTANAEHTRRDKEKFPERNRARYLIRQAMKKGKIKPLANCEYCKQAKKTEAHHPDHFQPYLIVWLCKDCHAMFDKYKIFGFGEDYTKEIQ